MAYCSKCGKNVHYSVKTCPDCGSTHIINDGSTFSKHDTTKRHGIVANPFKRGNIGWASLGFLGALLVVIAPILYFSFWKSAPKRASSIFSGAIAGYALWVIALITTGILYWWFPSALDNVIDFFKGNR